MKRDVDCICGHNLGQHPPDSQRPFAWPCRACGCTKYREHNSPWPIYILDAVGHEPTMKYVRIHRMHNGNFRVFEGLTHR
jgi:hypothetical protein